MSICCWLKVALRVSTPRHVLDKLSWQVSEELDRAFMQRGREMPQRWEAESLDKYIAAFSVGVLELGLGDTIMQSSILSQVSVITTLYISAGQ